MEWFFCLNYFTKDLVILIKNMFEWLRERVTSREAIASKNLLLLLINSEFQNSAFPQENPLIEWFIFPKDGCLHVPNEKNKHWYAIISGIVWTMTIMYFDWAK